jgi:hypothetical protein
MNTNEKPNQYVKWILIGVGAVFLCCCCIALLAALAFRQVQKGIKTDPASTIESAHAITDYELPQGYQEQIAMDILSYSLVMIAPVSEGSGKPIIMLAQFEAGVDPQLMEQQLQQSFEQQSGMRGTDMKLVETKEMTIRGEKAKVNVYEGADTNGNNIREWVAPFSGKNGTAIFIIMGDTETWDESLVENFIKSFR